jgi:ATP-dependent 26S proteasome regulatory subunit
MPQVKEREKVLNMTLSAVPLGKGIDMHVVAEIMDGYSYANVVRTAQRTAKYGILRGNESVDKADFEQAIAEGSLF